MTVGEEDVTLSPRLVGCDQPLKDLSFPGEPFGKREGHGGFDTLHACVRRVEATRTFGHLPAEHLKQTGIAPRVGQAFLPLTGLSDGAVRLDEMTGTRHGRSDQVGVDDLVDDAQRVRLLDRQQLAADDDIQRVLYADEAREALGAPGARHDTEGDLGKTHACARRSQTVVAPQRHFEATAGRDTVDGRNDGLRRVLDRSDDAGKMRSVRRWRLTKFADVGSATEHSTGPGNHERAHRVVGQRRRDVLSQPGTHTKAQPVHRRVIERDDRNAIRGRRTHDIRHPRSSVVYTSSCSTIFSPDNIA